VTILNVKIHYCDLITKITIALQFIVQA